jgi:hypothetical protein
MLYIGNYSQNFRELKGSFPLSIPFYSILPVIIIGFEAVVNSPLQSFTIEYFWSFVKKVEEFL